MSRKVTDSLSRERIQQLLAAVGSRPKEDTAQIETTEYSWCQPHYFDQSQLNKLNDFTKQVAEGVAKRFAHFCKSEFDVTVASTTQHFAAELLDQASDSKRDDYYLAFGIDQEHLCGLICIPTQTAFIWARQLLGDSGAEEDSRVDLSLLEESLLLDITSAIVEELSFVHERCTFQPAKSIVRRQLPFELQGTEELFKITFGFKKAGLEKDFEAYLLILCRKLEPVAGKTTRAAAKSSAGDISKVILGHLQEMTVPVTAQLASTVLTFEEIMNLQVGDILLMDKRVDQPVELIVEGRTVCYGWPAKSAGKYAVAITTTKFADKA